MDETVLPLPARRTAPISAITLVGFMGAGKTTVGRALAHRLNWHFADLDRQVEQYAGRSIEEIFSQQGEVAFREMEYLVLRQTIDSPDRERLVLALGGGAFIEDNVQRQLRAAGIPAICLDAPVEELFRRCEQPEVVRPLRHDPVQFRELYERRRPLYRKADLRIETHEKPIAAVVEEIISALNLVPASGVIE